MGEDAGSSSLSYVHTTAYIADPTDGSEDGKYEIDVRLAGTSRSRLMMDSTETVFNQESQDLDFRVESDSNANMIFVDASIDSVGIGTGSPSSTYALDVAGSIRTQGTAPGLTIYETDASNQQWILGGYSGFLAARDVTGGTYPLQIGTGAPTNSIMIQSGGVTINDNSADQDFRVESDSNANALFMDASTSYVGINRSPAVELDVQRISTSYPFRISASDGSARTMVFADSGGSPSRVNWLAGAQYNTDNGWELTPSTANGGYTFTNRVLTAYANGDLTVNENGISADFRVESDGNSHMLFVDGSTNRVGIGSSSPNKNVEILASNPTLRLEDTASGSKRLDIGVLDTAVAFIDAPQSAQTLKMSISGTESLTQYNNTNGVVFNESGADRDFRVESDSHVYAIFMNAANGTTSFGAATPQTATNFIGVGGIYINNGNQPSGDFMSIDAEGTSGGTKMTFYRYDSSATTYQNRFAIAGETSETVVNESGVDVDFRIESDSNANMLVVDGGNNRIGFGLSNPAQNFAVQFATAGRVGSFYDTGTNGNSMYNGAAVLGVSRASNGTTSLNGPIFEVGRDNDLTGTFNVSKSLFTVGSDKTVVNEDSEDYDFRVESDTFSSALNVDGGSGIVSVAHYFGIGKMAPGEQQSSGSGFFFVPGGTGYYSHISTVDTANFSSYFNRKGQTGGFFNFAVDNVGVGTVTYNGSVTVYGTSSDERLKENIADADDAGSKIDAMQVRKFDWKRNGHHQEYGMVAQELLPISPDSISQGDTEEDMMSVDYSTLVPMLIKEIQSLRARVAALES
jgi:hypothetical protein